MWETLRNAWKVEELRKKMIYTFLMLLLFRLVGVIPVSGINADVVKELAGTYDMLGLVNMMTGNSFSQMTIMAMGITPYINSSIIMQLLTVAIPALERMMESTTLSTASFCPMTLLCSISPRCRTFSRSPSFSFETGIPVQRDTTSAISSAVTSSRTSLPAAEPLGTLSSWRWMAAMSSSRALSLE